MRRGPLGGPALDDPGRVEDTAATDGEGAAGVALGGGAEREHPGDVGRARVERQLPPAEPGDRGVRAAGAEHPVRLPQHAHRGTPGGVRAGVAGVPPAQGEAERQAHDVRDVPAGGPGRDGPRGPDRVAAQAARGGGGSAGNGGRADQLGATGMRWVSGSGAPAGSTCASASSGPGGVVADAAESGAAGSGAACSAGPGSHRDPLCRASGQHLERDPVGAEAGDGRGDVGAQLVGATTPARSNARTSGWPCAAAAP